MLLGSLFLPYIDKTARLCMNIALRVSPLEIYSSEVMILQSLNACLR